MRLRYGLWGLRRLQRDTRGVVAIEFAFVVLMLIALILASIVMSLVYLTQTVLDSIADDMSRPLLLGQAPNMAGFRTQACASLPVYMSCSRLLINVKVVSQLSSASMDIPAVSVDASGNVSASTTYEPGSAGSIVVMQLLYVMPVPQGIGGFDAGTLANGETLLVSTSVIKVEPS